MFQIYGTRDCTVQWMPGQEDTRCSLELQHLGEDHLHWRWCGCEEPDVMTSSASQGGMWKRSSKCQKNSRWISSEISVCEARRSQPLAPSVVISYEYDVQYVPDLRNEIL